jgi:hypothetical protein
MSSHPAGRTAPGSRRHGGVTFLKEPSWQSDYRATGGDATGVAGFTYWMIRERDDRFGANEHP